MERVNWNDNRQPSTTLPPPNIFPLPLHQLPYPPPLCPQLKTVRKILRLYIKPRRIAILSGYPPIFPPNIATPRNPRDANIQTSLRDILPRADPPSEAERAEVLQIRTHAKRLAVGWPGRLEPAFRVEGFRVRVEGRFTVNSPLVRMDIYSGAQEEGGLGFLVS